MSEIDTGQNDAQRSARIPLRDREVSDCSSERSVDLVIRLDRQGRIEFVSDDAAQLLRVRVSELTGRTLSEIILTSELIDSLHKGVDKAARLGEHFGSEVAFKGPGNEQRLISWRFIPETNGKGEIVAVLVIGRDMTDRQIATQALQKSEARFKLAMLTSQDGIWDWNVKTDEVYYSPGYSAMLGYVESEIGRTAEFWMESIHAEDRAFVLDANADCIEGRCDTFEVEYRMRTKSGEWRWILGRGRVVSRDDSGRAVRLIGTHADITPRKQSEDALRESELRFREIFENMGNGAAIYEPVNDGEDFIFKDINPAGARIGGLEREQHIGRSVQEVYPGVKELGLFDVLRKVHRDGVPQWHPMSAYEDQRLTIWVENYVCRLPSGEVVTVYDDITERKRAEEALEKRLVALTQPLGDIGGLTFDELFNLEDIQKLQDEFAQATGVASIITRIDGTPITKPSNFCRLCRDIILETELGRANCRRSNATIENSNIDGPTIRLCLSGGLWDAGAEIKVGGRHIANWFIGQVRDESQTEKQMREYAREIGADEEAIVEAFREVPVMSREQFEHVAQALFTFADQLSNMAFQNVQQARFITERKQAEQQREELEAQLRHSQKMEAVGQLAGGIAHDFNNILTAILGNVELGMDIVRDELGEDHMVARSMLQIEEVAQRASALTRQLLTFSRRDITKPETLNLNEVLANLDKMLRRLITENISLKALTEPHLQFVRADAGQIEQVIVNLVVNAVHAMPDGGCLTLETQNVLLDENYESKHAEAKTGPHVLLAVSDTGHGIEPETLERIFEPFFTTKGPDKGTGLGLATVHGIVKRSGGHLMVYSEISRGSSFKVYLPAVKSVTEENATPIRSALISQGYETILLCEDDEAVRELIAQSLGGAGYQVIHANNGEEGLKASEKHSGPIDLLITDVVMPDINGRLLAQRLRTKRPDLPTLFISGYTANVIVHHGVLDRDVQFLEKPFTRQQLLEKVRNVLDQV